LYQLLVVDDELYALRGIVETIDWLSLGINKLYAASDAEEAKQFLINHPIDVMICDIEMPGESGLDLLKWLQSRNSQTESIVLTGHKRFAYVRTALQLGCFDYLLKPVEHEKLKETVSRVLVKTDERRNQQSFYRYKAMLQSQQGMMERFWQDVIERRPSVSSQESVAVQLSLIAPEVSADGLFLPVLISIDRWKERLGNRDKEILEYAIASSAKETVLGNWPGAVVKWRNGVFIAIAYLPEPIELPELYIKSRCRAFIGDCSTYFYSEVSCYIGQPGTIERIPDCCETLIDMERRNIARSGSLHTEGESPSSEEKKHPLPVSLPFPSGLAELLQMGKKDELLSKLEAWFAAYEKEKQLSQENLKAFYYHFLSLLYQAFHRSGISVDRMLEDVERQEEMAQATRSLPHLREWAVSAVEHAMNGSDDRKDHPFSVIDQIKRYVQTNLSHEVTREDIAAVLHFNPSYLSRLFKKETGLSLTDYIMDEKRKKRKSCCPNRSLR
jgi:two-component system response regulator YesN